MRSDDGYATEPDNQGPFGESFVNCFMDQFSSSDSDSDKASPSVGNGCEADPAYSTPGPLTPVAFSGSGRSLMQRFSPESDSKSEDMSYMLNRPVKTVPTSWPTRALSFSGIPMTNEKLDAPERLLPKRRGRGRKPTKYDDNNIKRRKHYKAVTQALKAGAPVQPVGRPSGKNRTTATILNTNSRRKSRVEQKATKVCSRALETLVAVISTTAGRKAFPELQPKLAKLRTFAEAGQGATALAHKVGGAQKRFHVRYLVEHVTDLKAYAELSGFPLKYLNKQKNLNESRLMEDVLPESMFWKRQPHMFSPSSSHEFVEAICTRFFKAHTGIFSGARSGTRQLGMKHHELMFNLYAEYPGYCRDVAAVWPAEVQAIREKKQTSTKLTETEGMLLASIDVAKNPAFDERKEFKDRKTHSEKQYQRQLIERRLSKKFRITRTQVRSFIKAPQDAQCRHDTTDGMTDAFIEAQALLELDPAVQSKPPSEQEMLAQTDSYMRSQMQVEDLFQNFS